MIKIFLPCVAAAAALGIASCHSGDSDSTAKAADMPSARVAVAQRGDISRVLTLAGQFQPYQVVDVHPKVSGYMKRINVDIGDIVHQGQTLAILEVPELKAELEQSVFQLKQSQEEIALAQQEIKRAEALDFALHAQYDRLKQAAATRPGLIAQQELDDARAKDLDSQAQIDAAKAAMAAAQQHAEAARAENERVQALEDYTNVTAPIAGVVIWRYADTGALIQGGTNSNDSTLPIVRLSQSTLLRLRVPVPEDDIQYVHEGELVDVRVDAINRSFTGKIVRFTRDVNFETRTMETEVDVDNKDLSIAPGMYANTALQLAHAENTVTIPVEALVSQCPGSADGLRAGCRQSHSYPQRSDRNTGIEARPDHERRCARRTRADRWSGKVPRGPGGAPARHIRARLRNRAATRRHDRPEG